MKTVIAIIFALLTVRAPMASSVKHAASAQSTHADVVAVAPVPQVTVTLPTVTIVGHLPAKKVVTPKAHVKRFVCGAVYENAVGGHNSDCFWK